MSTRRQAESDRRLRVVLDCSANFTGPIGSGESVDHVQGHVDAG